MKLEPIFTTALSFLLVQGSMGQGRYMTGEGTLTFYSHTVIEDITAENKEVAGVLDAGTGDVAVVVKMTAFRFEKKLMQEHFNENYVESEKFPRSTFNGTVVNNKEVDYTKQGSYPVKVEGELTIHGVTRKISAGGTLEVGKTDITARTTFMIHPEDYDIRIPGVVRDNIAETVEVTAELPLKPI
jgi:hypothetical protein